MQEHSSVRVGEGRGRGEKSPLGGVGTHLSSDGIQFTNKKPRTAGENGSRAGHSERRPSTSADPNWIEKIGRLSAGRCGT